MQRNFTKGQQVEVSHQQGTERAIVTACGKYDERVSVEFTQSVELNGRTVDIRTRGSYARSQVRPV